jgi:hypothetical protein
MTQRTDALRVWVDLNEWDHVERSVSLPTRSIAALKRLGITVREGLVLHLYSDDLDDNEQRDDLIVDGVAHYDRERARWLAASLGPIRNVLELDRETREKMADLS